MYKRIANALVSWISTDFLTLRIDISDEVRNISAGIVTELHI